MLIQSGKMGNPTTYFKELLKQYTRKESEKVKPLAIMSEPVHRRGAGKVGELVSMLMPKLQEDITQEKSASLEKQEAPVDTTEKPNCGKETSEQDQNAQLLKKLMFEFKISAIHALAAVDRVPDQELRQAIDEIKKKPNRARLIISELIRKWPDESRKL